MILLALSVIACSEAPQPETVMKQQTEPTPKAKVTGIGGIFFKCEDPAAVKAWFTENLGLVTNEYGSLFEFNVSPNPKDKGYLQWSPFAATTKYFEPSDKNLMVNYRVDDLELLANQLQENGVKLLDTIESYDYGKFLHILDPENNKIELWQPVDNTFTESEQGKNTVNVTIGGLFFKAEDPQMLAKWYAENLGIVSDQHGKMFNFYHPVHNDRMEYLQWSIFPASSDYFEGHFMVNYCVSNLSELADQLTANGVVLTDSIATYEYGSFLHVLSPENNKIELWEPNYAYGE